MCLQYPRWPEGGVGSPRTGVTGVYEPSATGGWELSPDVL